MLIDARADRSEIRGDGTDLAFIELTRNPLRRPSDKLEGRVTLLLLAFVLLAGPFLAWRTGAASYREA